MECSAKVVVDWHDGRKGLVSCGATHNGVPQLCPRCVGADCTAKRLLAERTIKGGRFNLAFPEGHKAADQEADRRFSELMKKEPAVRYEYLTKAGWTRGEKREVEQAGKKFVQITWWTSHETAQRLYSGRRQRPAYFNQTAAIQQQIWLDMEDDGLLLRPQPHRH
jgi:hypothetical protein